RLGQVREVVGIIVFAKEALAGGIRLPRRGIDALVEAAEAGRQVAPPRDEDLAAGADRIDVGAEGGIVIFLLGPGHAAVVGAEEASVLAGDDALVRGRADHG